MNTTNEMQLYKLIYYSWSSLHVSGDVYAHHQEHLTVFTASGNMHQCRCQLVSWMSCNHRPKHVEPTRDHKLTYIVAACWLCS